MADGDSWNVEKEIKNEEASSNTLSYNAKVLFDSIQVFFDTNALFESLGVLSHAKVSFNSFDVVFDSNTYFESFWVVSNAKVYFDYFQVVFDNNAYFE